MPVFEFADAPPGAHPAILEVADGEHDLPAHAAAQIPGIEAALAEAPAVVALAEERFDDAEQIVTHRPRFLRRRGAPGYLHPYIDAVEARIAAALLAALRITLAAPPPLHVVPTTIAPTRRPSVRGIPISPNAPPAQLHCCR